MLYYKNIDIQNKIKIKDISKEFYKINFIGNFGKTYKYFKKEIQLYKNNQKNMIEFRGNNYNIINTYKSIFKYYLEDIFYGYSLILELRGVGYKVLYDKENNVLIFDLGLSHSIKYILPVEVFAKVVDKKNTIFCLLGNNREIVQNTAVKIKNLIKKDHYKGKGIFYYNENFLLKKGKSKKI